MSFISLKQYLNEIDGNLAMSNMSKEQHQAWEDLYDEGVTVLYPGGFKPMTGGHIDLIKRYANHEFVKEVKVLVGPGVRNGITQEMAMEIATTLLDQFGPKISIEAVKYPSPLLTAYKYIGEEAAPGNYALAASSKGEDYKRVKDFTEQHQPGGKYAASIEKGVRVLELPLNVEPKLYTGRTDAKEGEPISASTLRADVLKGDYENFRTNYPENDDADAKNVWAALEGRLVEDEPKPVKKSKVKESVNELFDTKQLIKWKRDKDSDDGEYFGEFIGPNNRKYLIVLQDMYYMDIPSEATGAIRDNVSDEEFDKIVDWDESYYHVEFGDIEEGKDITGLGKNYSAAIFGIAINAIMELLSKKKHIIGLFFSAKEQNRQNLYSKMTPIILKNTDFTSVVNGPEYYFLTRNKKSVNEDTVTPSVNKHMTHAEDLVILGGPSGLMWVNKMLNSLFNDLRGETPEEKVTLSVKIDGAPAIFAWSSFPGLRQPGISMKGLFAKEPKVFYSIEEIEAGFSDKPELMYKLATFLKHLPAVGIPEGQIWQGDFLYSDESLKEAEIDGENYFAFHPNTIYYVVPQDSDLGERIAKSKVGIVWHTRYTGKDLENVKANYDAKVEELNDDPEIFMTDPYIRSFAGLLNFTKEESDEIEGKLLELKKLSATLIAMNSYEELISNKDLVSLFSIFQNSLIKANITVEGPSDMFARFIEFIEKRYAKEADTKKTEKGKDQTLRKAAELIDTLEQDRQTMGLMIKIIMLTTDLKSTFINKLNKVGSFQTYLKMKGDQLRKTNHEGFAVSDIHGSVVKLVDRSEFSFSNFSPEVQKGWEK